MAESALQLGGAWFAQAHEADTWYTAHQALRSYAAISCGGKWVFAIQGPSRPRTLLVLIALLFARGLLQV